MISAATVGDRETAGEAQIDQMTATNMAGRPFVGRQT